MKLKTQQVWNYSKKNDKENSAHCVYIHVNKINKKVYVGRTYNLKARWAAKGIQYKQCTAFWNAIKKYGWDNFYHIIIKSDLTLEESKKIERELIALYESNTQNGGYNLSEGGEGICGNKQSEELRHRRSLIAKNKLATDPIYRDWFYTQVQIKGIEKTKKKSHHICQFDLEGNFLHEWSSVVEATQALGFKNVTNIKNACVKKYRRAGDYYWCYLEDKEGFSIPSYEKHQTRVEDLRTGKIYNSFKEAAIDYGYTSPSFIARLCDEYEKGKTAKFRRLGPKIPPTHPYVGKTNKESKEIEDGKRRNVKL